MRLAITFERLGVPAISISYPEFREYDKKGGRTDGMTAVRVFYSPRAKPNLLAGDIYCPDPADARRVITEHIDEIVGLLTTTLTEEEKRSYTIPEYIPPRAAVSGSYDKIQAFFQSKYRPDVYGTGPVCSWTDGLPIVPPTVKKVREMLKGTSHAPGKIVYTSQSGWGLDWERGFGSTNWYFDVKKVAINGVMAGCKPEHMPVLLAIASRGVGYSATSSAPAKMMVVSGPYAKEIGMNHGMSCMLPGSPANMPIGRAARLMEINLGDGVPGPGDQNSHGNPATYSFCFAEDVENTPWKTLGESLDFSKDESIIAFFGPNGPMSFKVSAPWDVGLAMALAYTSELVSHPSRYMAGAGNQGCVVTLTATAAQLMADIGYTKDEYAEHICDLIQEIPVEMKPDPPGGIAKPENIRFIVAGVGMEKSMMIVGRPSVKSIDDWR